MRAQRAQRVSFVHLPSRQSAGSPRHSRRRRSNRNNGYGSTVSGASLRRNSLSAASTAVRIRCAASWADTRGSRARFRQSCSRRAHTDSGSRAMPCGGARPARPRSRSGASLPAPWATSRWAYPALSAAPSPARRSNTWCPDSNRRSKLRLEAEPYLLLTGCVAPSWNISAALPSPPTNVLGSTPGTSRTARSSAAPSTSSASTAWSDASRASSASRAHTCTT